MTFHTKMKSEAVFEMKKQLEEAAQTLNRAVTTAKCRGYTVDLSISEYGDVKIAASVPLNLLEE